MRSLRQLLHHWTGHGPHSLAAFAEIARARTDYAPGVHRAEDFTGLLTSATSPAVVLRPGHALLGQVPAWEQLPDGPRYREDGLVPIPTKHLYSLAEGAIITGDGIVYCPRTRRAVAETVRQWTAPANRHPVLGALGYPAARRLAGRALNLATLSGEGFYHFLLEALPRLWLARPWLDQIDHFLCNGSHRTFHARWLAQAGIPPEKIVWMSGLCHYSSPQVLFTDDLMRDQQPGAWNVAALRGLFPPASPARPGRRLWVSRQDAQVRHLAWESELLGQLPGFESVRLSELSPADQLRLASEAAVIAGPHGAGLSLLAFAAPGVRLVELFPHPQRQPVYDRLCQLVPGSYAWAVTDFQRPDGAARLAGAIQSFLDQPPAR